MQKRDTLALSLLIFSSIILSGCDAFSDIEFLKKKTNSDTLSIPTVRDTTETGKKKLKNGLRIDKDSYGRVTSKINYKDGMRHGMAINYYKNGKVRGKVAYKMNKRTGRGLWYHENGKVYKDLNFVNDKKEGLQKKYYKSGKLMSEAVFKEGLPGVNLKEYTTQGKLKKLYPAIEIKGVNKINEENEYIIYVKLKNNNFRKVKFYEGELYKGSYFSKYSIREIEKIDNNTAKLTVHVNRGSSVMKKLNFVVVINTPLRNKKIIQKSFNLAVTNY